MQQRFVIKENIAYKNIEFMYFELPREREIKRGRENSTMKQLHKHARTLESAQPMVQRATSGHFLKPRAPLHAFAVFRARRNRIYNMCPQTTQWKLKVGKEGRESLTRLYRAFTKETHARVLWRNCPFLETCVNGRNQLWNGGGRYMQTSLKQIKTPQTISPLQNISYY